MYLQVFFSVCRLDALPWRLQGSPNRYLEEMIMKAHHDSLRSHNARITQAAVREVNRHESPLLMVPANVQRVSPIPEPLEEQQKVEEGGWRCGIV